MSRFTVVGTLVLSSRMARKSVFRRLVVLLRFPLRLVGDRVTHVVSSCLRCRLLSRISPVLRVFLLLCSMLLLRLRIMVMLTRKLRAENMTRVVVLPRMALTNRGLFVPSWRGFLMRPFSPNALVRFLTSLVFVRLLKSTRSRRLVMFPVIVVRVPHVLSIVTFPTTPMRYRVVLASLPRRTGHVNNC